MTDFCNQVKYHPYMAQDELLGQARGMDYLLTAYSPVAKGRVLNGATIREIGETHGKSSAQVALAVAARSSGTWPRGSPMPR